VNELAVNLPSKRVDHAYLKVLIVGEATVAPVLGKLFAVDDRLSVGAELNADAISHRNAVFHIKEKSLQGIIPWLCAASQALDISVSAEPTNGDPHSFRAALPALRIRFPRRLVSDSLPGANSHRRRYRAAARGYLGCENGALHLA
jgi:hypothetical protein